MPKPKHQQKTPSPETLPDIPVAPAGATPQEREELHQKYFAELDRKRRDKLEPQHDAHVHSFNAARKKVEFATEVAARFGRLPLTWEQLNEPPPPDPAQSPEAAFAAQLERRRAKFEAMCPPLYREAWDWAKVKPEVSREEAQKVLGWQMQARGLYVAGDSGHSKTRALYTLVRRLVVQEKREVLVMDGIAFSNLCTRAFGDPANTEALFRPLLRADVLAIDDLAKRWTPATEEGAFMILDRRTAHLRPVLITINYTASDLYRMQEARGDIASIRDVSTPLIRRLVDYCQAVAL